MPIYPCPECGAQLKPAKAVAPGKKLRCPKCETVFAVSAAPAGKKPAEKAAASVLGGDEAVTAYGVIKTEGEDAQAEERMKAAFEPIQDRFKRSTRGPALIHVVRPSDWLLRTGVLICVCAVAGALISVWPMIFKSEAVQPEEKKNAFKYSAQSDKKVYIEMKPEEWRERFIFLGVFVFQFGWGSMVCAGASKMHTLESYAWAMIGSVMVMVGPGVPLGVYGIMENINDPDPLYMPLSILCLLVPGIPIGLWNIAILRKPEVIAGFQEEKPDDGYG